MEEDEAEVRRLEAERVIDEIASSTLTNQRQQHLDSIKKAVLACQAFMGVLRQDELRDNDDHDENPNEWWQQTRKNQQKYECTYLVDFTSCIRWKA